MSSVNDYGYSHVRVVENPSKTFYVAGQISANENYDILHLGDIEGQIEVCFQRISKVLSDSGASMEHVVMLRCYLMDMENHFDAYIKILKKYFPGPNPPASTLVQVSRLALKGLLVEIDAVATL